jgi:hypothetical protein
MNVRSPIPVPAAVLLCALVLWPAPSRSSVCRKLTLEELVKLSTLVVEAECTLSQSFLSPDRRRISTRADLRVEEVFKGKAGGEASVWTPGGRVGKLRQVVSGAPKLKKGERVLLFLWKNRRGRYMTVGLRQGKFLHRIDEKKGTWFCADYAGLRFIDPATGKVLDGAGHYAPRRVRARVFRAKVREIAQRQRREEEARRKGEKK